MLRRPWLLNLILLAAIAAAGVRLSGLVRSPLPELPAAPATGEGRESGASGAGPGEAGSEAARPAGGPPGAAGDGEYEVIAARDLFSQARGTPPPRPAAPGAVAAAPKPQPPPKIALFGVVILDGEKSAFLLEGAGDAKPRKVREGESFAGGTLRSIRPDGVTLALPTGEVSVALRAPKEGLPGVAPTAQPQVPAAQPRPPAAVPARPPAAVQRRGIPAGAAVPVPGTVAAPRFTPAPAPGAGEDLYEEDLGEDEYDEEYFEEDEEFLDEEEDLGE